MSSRDPSDISGQLSSAMPRIVTPMRRTPIFLKALWVLALLVAVGVAYSFWRISRVPTPKLDVPPAAEPAPAPANSQTTRLRALDGATKRVAV